MCCVRRERKQFSLALCDALRELPDMYLCLRIFVRTQELNIRCIFLLGIKELSPRLWLCNEVVGARSQTSLGSIWLRTCDHPSYLKILQNCRNDSTFLAFTWKNRLATPPEVSSALIMKVWETPNHYKLYTVLCLVRLLKTEEPR